MNYFILLTIFDISSLVLLINKISDESKMRVKKTGILLLVLFATLLFSQMIMYAPGSEISPYAYTRGLLKHITVFNKTYSSWASMIFALCCCLSIFYRKFRGDRLDLIITFTVILIFAIGVVNSDSPGAGISNGTKFILPFIVYFYIKSDKRLLKGDILDRILDYTNIVLVLQVAVSKVLTGSFAASRYYVQMKEEYFGFFNHPHNFTGILGLCTIWCIYNINNKRHTLPNLILFLCNVLLMYISGSRSYVYALLVALGYIVILSLARSELKSMKKYAYAAVVMTVFFGSAFISNLGAARGSGNTNMSGRGERWIGDLMFYANKMNLLEKIFGGGFEYVNRVNKIISGVYINSLNIFIDFLIDTGIVGVILMTFSFGGMFYYFIKNNNKIFAASTALFFLLASFATNLVDYQLVTIYMVLLLFAMKTNTNGAAKNEREQKKLF